MAAHRIALDAFGGDSCPDAEIEGAVIAAKAGTEVVLVGDEAILAPKLGSIRGASRLPIEIVHASDSISMSESPGRAVRSKPEASMPVCFELVRTGRAHAVVSAGNSGAMLACGLFKFGRIKGLDRPAILTTFPADGGPCCLLDMGANVDCRVLNFAQFAVLGACFVHGDVGHRRVRVGVLSNGSEDSKGTELTRAVHQLLRTHESPSFEYIGYVEGKDIFNRVADVVVTDGFTGNVALKVAEGTIEAFGRILKGAIGERLRAQLGAVMMRSAFDEVRRQLDPDSHGGAPLLGVKGIAVICHGGASAKAIANGIGAARRCVERDLTPRLSAWVSQNESLFQEARNASVAGS